MKSDRNKKMRHKLHLPLHLNVHRLLFALPNLFTLSSIFCGFYAMILASGKVGPEQLYKASLAVFFGIFFDMADGRVARLTRTQSNFGIQLDSLADQVTFGVAPAFIVYRWGLSNLGLLGAFASFVYVACGAIRLARYNIIATQSRGKMRYFIGAPIPLAAGVIISLVMFHQQTIATSTTYQIHIFAVMLIISYLMISNVRFRTFKDLKLTKWNMGIVCLFVILFIVLANLFKPAFALLFYFWTYLTLGLLEAVVFYQQRRLEDNSSNSSETPSSDSSQLFPEQKGNP